MSGTIELTTLSLRDALEWALDYIADGDDGTPTHVCEFTTNPEKGACDFHERYWSAREALRAVPPAPDTVLVSCEFLDAAAAFGQRLIDLRDRAFGADVSAAPGPSEPPRKP